MPVEMDIASEYRYRNPVVGPGDLVVGITQSGETADTLAAMRLAREAGATVLAVTNIMGSQATRDADAVLYTRAGLEIGVAATKTFLAQVAAMYLLGLRIAELRETLPAGADRRAGGRAEGAAVEDRGDAGGGRGAGPPRSPPPTATQNFFLYLGRHIGLPVCLEGALKLKEISYIPTDAYAAGEMKHGPIALLDESTPVVCIATDEPGPGEGPLQRRGGARPRRPDDRDRHRRRRARRRSRRRDDRGRRAPTGSCSRSSRSCRCSCSPTTSPAPAASTSTSPVIWPRPSPSSDRHRVARMRRPVKARLVLLVAAATAALAVAGCGGGGDSGAGPGQLAPPKSPLFIEATVQPEGELKSNIDSLAKSIAGIDDLGDLIVAELEKSASDDGERIRLRQGNRTVAGRKGRPLPPEIRRRRLRRLRRRDPDDRHRRQPRNSSTSRSKTATKARRRLLRRRRLRGRGR